MVKNANFGGLRRIWEFLPILRGVVILPPSQPRNKAIKEKKSKKIPQLGV